MDSFLKRPIAMLAFGGALLCAGCNEAANENQQVTTVGPDGDPGYDVEDLEGEDFRELAGNPLTADVDEQQPQPGGAELSQQPGSTATPEDPNRAETGQAPNQAVAVLSPVGDSGVRGTVSFTQQDGGLLIAANLTGLEPGQHGFHVHQFGECGDNGNAAGDHWNPHARNHGDPAGDPGERHVGDLGNVEANEQGMAQMERVDNVITFEGENNILGKALIVHMMPDDLTTQPSGDSGDPVACGVIEGGAELTQEAEQPRLPENV